MKGGIGRGARGRGFAATPPGGPGSPSAPTTWGCLQWLDAAWMKGGESRLDTVSAPGSTVPVDRKAAGGAPCGERASQKARQRREALDRWLRRTALHSLAMGGGQRKTGLPGASTKNTGGGALAKAV